MNERRRSTFWANFVIVATLLITFSVAFISANPGGDKSETVGGAIYEGERESGSVALMFNVYENTRNVQSIASLLSEYGFSATFFVGGSWVAHNQSTLVELAAGGFEIGNHGYLHRDHAKLSVDGNIEEIRLAERLVDDILKDLPDYSNCKLFAPPSGSMSKNMFEACRQLDYRVIMWTRDTIDWRDHDVNLIYDRAVRNINAGDLILMHPTDCTVAALPKILDYIKSAGLTADTVSKVIGALES